MSTSLFEQLMTLETLWSKDKGAENVHRCLMEKIFPNSLDPIDAVLYFIDCYDHDLFPNIVMGSFSNPEVGSFEEIVLKTYQSWLDVSHQLESNLVVQQIFNKLQRALSNQNCYDIAQFIACLGIQRLIPSITFISLVPHALIEEHKIVDLSISNQSIHLEREFVQFLDNLLLTSPTILHSIWGQNGQLLPSKLEYLIEFYLRRYGVAESFAPNLKKQKEYCASTISMVKSSPLSVVPVPLYYRPYFASPIANQFVFELPKIISVKEKKEKIPEPIPSDPLHARVANTVQFALTNADYSAWRAAAAKSCLPKKRKPLEIKDPKNQFATRKNGIKI